MDNKVKISFWQAAQRHIVFKAGYYLGKVQYQINPFDPRFKFAGKMKEGTIEGMIKNAKKERKTRETPWKTGIKMGRNPFL